MDEIAISVEEFRKRCGLGRNAAYALIHQKGFPAVWIGKRVIIPIDQLKRWMQAKAEAGNEQ